MPENVKRYILIPMKKKSIQLTDISDLMGNAEKLAKRFEQKGRVPKIMWLDDPNTKQMLTSLTSTKKLYISAYGDDEHIETRSDRINHTPENLAVLLSNYGLSHDCEDVRLFTSHSAEYDASVEKDGGKYQAPITEEQEKETYAYKLKTCLEALGYKKVAVSGYMGNIEYIEKNNKIYTCLGLEDQWQVSHPVMINGKYLRTRHARLRFFASEYPGEQQAVKTANIKNIEFRKAL